MRSTLLTLHDPSLAREFYAAGLWRDETLYSRMASHAATHPDGYAFQDRRHRLTWAQTRDWVDGVAADLHAAGLRCGDRVAVWLPNRVESIVVLLACSRNGYVASLSLHQNHTVAEVKTLLERLSVAAFFGQPGYGADSDRNDIFALLPAMASVRRIYVLDPLDNPAPARPENAFIFPEPNSGAELPAVNRNPDKVTYIAFTSGTTGQPKALMHSDNTLLSNGRTMVADWGHDRSTVLYCLGPLSHHLAMIGVEQALVAGFEYITNDLTKGMKALDRILETGATYVMGVPTHAIDILQEVAARGLGSVGAVKIFYMSGASIPAEVARRFMDYGIVPQNTYGMTEGGSHTNTLPTDDIDTMVRTVGQTCGRGNPCYEIRIWKADDRDTEAAPGEVGEIGGRGAALMLGYFGNQEATQNSFNAHGFFMSGDLGRIDAKGNIEIAGRSKDLIIRGGHNIYPVEIENLALRHPAVIKAAAIPVPDDRLGEKVCLAVIVKEGAGLPGPEMLEHLAAEGLSKYDMPEFFAVCEEFPLTPSGKVLKRQMILDLNDGRFTPEPVRYRDPAQAAK